MEMGVLIRALFALLLVVGLIGLAAVLARRMGLDKRLGGIGQKSSRLGVSDSLTIDPRHRLVLVRRDNIEHLLLLSMNGDTVIESGIPARQEPQGTGEERA